MGSHMVYVAARTRSRGHAQAAAAAASDAGKAAYTNIHDRRGVSHTATTVRKSFSSTAAADTSSIIYVSYTARINYVQRSGLRRMLHEGRRDGRWNRGGRLAKETGPPQYAVWRCRRREWPALHDLYHVRGAKISITACQPHGDQTRHAALTKRLFVSIVTQSELLFSRRCDARIAIYCSHCRHAFVN